MLERVPAQQHVDRCSNGLAWTALRAVPSARQKGRSHHSSDTIRIRINHLYCLAGAVLRHGQSFTHMEADPDPNPVRLHMCTPLLFVLPPHHCLR